MKKNILIGFACGALLLALIAVGVRREKGASIFRDNSTQTIKPAVPPPGPELTKWEVEIFDAEYRPKFLTIRKGETVTWTNKGTRQNWPASDPHPTHTKYPIPGGCISSKFDACKGLIPGESYTFQFDRTGVWTYHDHLAPGLDGTIDVEP